MTPSTILAARTIRHDGPAARMAADLACEATEELCRLAGVEPARIDMIVTLSVSPSNMAIRSQIIGPRFGYIVHRALGCGDAFVLDLVDADWIFAIEQASLFASNQHYRHVLIVRAECLADMSGDRGWAIADGAAALLLTPGDAPVAAAYHRLPGAPLIGIALGGGRAGDLARVTRAADVPSIGRLAPTDWLAGDRVLVERWGDDADGAPDVCSMMDLVGQMAAARSDGAPRSTTLVGLDPFKARLGRIEVML